MDSLGLKHHLRNISLKVGAMNGVAKKKILEKSDYFEHSQTCTWRTADGKNSGVQVVGKATISVSPDMMKTRRPRSLEGREDTALR